MEAVLKTIETFQVLNSTIEALEILKSKLEKETEVCTKVEGHGRKRVFMHWREVTIKNSVCTLSFSMLKANLDSEEYSEEDFDSLHTRIKKKNVLG